MLYTNTVKCLIDMICISQVLFHQFMSSCFHFSASHYEMNDDGNCSTSRDTFTVSKHSAMQHISMKSYTYWYGSTTCIHDHILLDQYTNLIIDCFQLFLFFFFLFFRYLWRVTLDVVKPPCSLILTKQIKFR